VERCGVRRLTFLFASTPITAHTLNPLPVAARLIARGHRVIWYAAGRFHDRISDVGAEPYGFSEAREHADLAAAYGGAGSPRAIAGLRQDRCEALILLGPQSPATTLAELAARMPVIVVARGVRHPAVDVVRTADAEGLHQAVGHQPRQRLAHRGKTDGKLFGKAGDVQLLAGEKAGGEDVGA
jgi:DNA-binding LacI/PurR family transcriptional regulator